MIRNVTDPGLSINISNRKELKLLTRVSKSTKNLTELRYILTKLEPSRECVNKQMVGQTSPSLNTRGTVPLIR